MTTKQYITLAVTGTIIFLISYAAATFLLALIFDDAIEEVSYDSEESSHEETNEEWAKKHGYTLASITPF